MKTYRSTYNYTWTKITAVENVRIRQRAGEYRYTTTQRTSQTTTAFEGRFEVEIDLEAIATLMCRRAGYSKTGKCVLLGGLAKVKRLSATPTASKTESFPVDETKWEILEPEQAGGKEGQA